MSTYEVADLHGPVVQGEGPHAGWPCFILRLARCNMWPLADRPSPTCPWCDSPELHKGRIVQLPDLLTEIEWLMGKHPEVKGLILTGGEPLLQADAELMEELSILFRWVDVETNGSVAPKFAVPENVSISCSPKAKNLHHAIRPHWFKILVPAKAELIGYVESFCRTNARDVPIYLQPVEVGGFDSPETRRNTENALALCYATGHRLSIQLHKAVGVR